MARFWTTSFVVVFIISTLLTANDLAAQVQRSCWVLRILDADGLPMHVIATDCWVDVDRVEGTPSLICFDLRAETSQDFSTDWHRDSRDGSAWRRKYKIEKEQHDESKPCSDGGHKGPELASLWTPSAPMTDAFVPGEFNAPAKDGPPYRAPERSTPSAPQTR